MPEQISREEAIEIIEQADRGILTIAESEPVPIIGHLDEDQNPKINVAVAQYQFGDESLEFNINQ